MLPDFLLPKNWVISYGDLTMPPLPASEEAFLHAILEGQDRMTEEERNRPENVADNKDTWWLRLTREREEAVEFHDPPRPRHRWTAEGRDRWWGHTGHTVASTIAAARRHASMGNQTLFRLMPMPPRPLPPKCQRRGGCCFSLCFRILQIKHVKEHGCPHMLFW